jgi:hypothetical protein
VLTNARRRVIAACASVLLVLGLGVLTTSPSQADDSLHEVSGFVNSPTDPGGLADVAVRFYRATGNEDEPWTLQATTYSEGGKHGGDPTKGYSGQYEAHVPAGTYRVTYNEFDDGGSVWDAWNPTTYIDSEYYGYASEFVITDRHRGLANVELNYRDGGFITGTVTDQCGAHVAASVYEYDANDTEPQMSLRASGSADGTYSIHALVGPSKLQIGGYKYESQWLGAASFADATTISVAPGSTSTGHDIVIKRILNTIGANPTVDGRVVTDQGAGIPGVTVRFYRSTGDSADPWELAGSTKTWDTKDDRGVYTTSLPVGAYRMTINEPDGSPASNTWLPDYGPTGTSIATARLFCGEAGEGRPFGDTTLNYRGGLVSGRVTDTRGKALKGVKVEAYDAASPDSAPAPILTTTTDANGNYSTHGGSEGTKLRFSDAGVHADEWYDDASTFADATTISAPAGAESTGNDIVLADVPTRSTKAPSVKGSGLYPSTLSTSGGEWNYPVHKTYRWYRTVHGKRSPISHATSSKYKVHESDIGSEISVRVTGRAISRYVGVGSANAYSVLRDRILRSSSTRISSTFEYSHGTMTVHITIRMAGVKHPKGKLRVDYYAHGDARHSHRKTFSFTDGKVTLKAKIKGVAVVSASYAGTSTIEGSSDARESNRYLR